VLNVQSCGCLSRELSRARGHSRKGVPLKHGWAIKDANGSQPAVYQQWGTMRQRCNNPRNPRYPDYGGRGIRIFPEWDSFPVYHRYIVEHLGPRPSPKHQIDRIDNDSHYWPGNLRWGTPEEQNNNKRNNRCVTWKGETLTVAQWAKRIGIDYKLLHRRLTDGWTIEHAFEQPPRRTKLIMHQGVALTAAEWARKSGIPERTLHGRLARGLTIEQALAQQPRYRRRHLSYNGNTLTIAQWARRVGINRKTLHSRLANGWSIKRAFERRRAA